MALADLLRQTVVNDGGSANSTGATPTQQKKNGGLASLIKQDELPEAEVEELTPEQVDDSGQWFYQQPGTGSAGTTGESDYGYGSTSSAPESADYDYSYEGSYTQPEKETPTVQPITENTESVVENIIEQENANAQSQAANNALLQRQATEENNNKINLPMVGNVDLSSFQKAVQGTVDQLNEDNGTNLRANVPDNTNGIYNWNWRNGTPVQPNLATVTDTMPAPATMAPVLPGAESVRESQNGARSLMDAIMNLGVTPAYGEDIAQADIARAVQQNPQVSASWRDNFQMNAPIMSGNEPAMAQYNGRANMQPMTYSTARSPLEEAIEQVNAGNYRMMDNPANAYNIDQDSYNRQLAVERGYDWQTPEQAMQNAYDKARLDYVANNQTGFTDKLGMAVENRWNNLFANQYNKDLARWDWIQQQPEFKNAGTEEEMIAAEESLGAKYDQMVDSGEIVEPADAEIVSSRDIADRRNQAAENAKQGHEEYYDKNYSGWENVLDNIITEGAETNTLRSEAEQAAIKAGYSPYTPEGAKFVDDYMKDVKNYNGSVNDANALRQEQLAMRNQMANSKAPAETTYDTESGAKTATLNDVVDYGIPGYDSEGMPNKSLQSVLQGESSLGQVPTERPGYNADGTPNATLQAILSKNGFNIVDGYDISQFKDTAPDIYETLRRNQSEGYLGLFDAKFGTASGGFEGITIPDSIKKFIASSAGTSVGNENMYYVDPSTNEVKKVKSNGKVETVDASADEYVKAVDELIKANKSLQDMVNAGIITKDDVMRHFFKKLSETKEDKTSSKSYGGGGGGGSKKSSSSGGGGGGGGRSSSGGYGSAPSTTTDQKQARINNIMKNWTF